MFKAKPTWRKTIPMECKYCGAQVFYHENSNGSKVFFDELGPPWPLHECAEYLNTKPEIDDYMIDDLEESFSNIIQNEPEIDFDLGNDFDFTKVKYKNDTEVKHKTEHELKYLNDRNKFRKKAQYFKQNKEIRRVFPAFQQIYDIGYIRLLEKNIDIMEKEKIDENELNYSTLPKKWVKNKLVKINIVTHDVFDKFFHSYTGYASQNEVEKMGVGKLVRFKVKGEDIAFGTLVWNFVEIQLF